MPQDELARFGVGELQLAEGQVDANFSNFMKFQIARAREEYRSAERGVTDLIGSTSQLTVRVMERLYGAILDAIEAQRYDIFRTRAHVPTGRKIKLLIACQHETMSERLRSYWC